MNKTILIGRIRSQDPIDMKRDGDVVIKNVMINGKPSFKIFQRDPLWIGFEAVSRAWDKICGNRNLTEEFELASNTQGAASETRADLKSIETALRGIRTQVSKTGICTFISKENSPVEKKLLNKIFLSEVPEGKVYFKMDEAFSKGELKESANRLLNGCVDYPNFQEGLDWIEKCRSYPLDHQFTHAELEHMTILSLKIENQIEANLKVRSSGKNDLEFQRIRRMLNETKVRIEENAVGAFTDDLNEFVSKMLFPGVSNRWLTDLKSELSDLRFNFGKNFYFEYQKIDKLLHALVRHWEDLFDKSDQHTSVKAELMPVLIRIVDTFDKQKESGEFPEDFSAMMAELRTKIKR
jgi:hypothetical protein